MAPSYSTPHSLPQRKPVISRSLTKFKNIIILLSPFLCCLIFRGNSERSLCGIGLTERKQEKTITLKRQNSAKVKCFKKGNWTEK